MMVEQTEPPRHHPERHRRKWNQIYRLTLPKFQKLKTITIKNS